jgi:hypothetical protein
MPRCMLIAVSGRLCCCLSVSRSCCIINDLPYGADVAANYCAVILSHRERVPRWQLLTEAHAGVPSSLLNPAGKRLTGHLGESPNSAQLLRAIA